MAASTTFSDRTAAQQRDRDAGQRRQPPPRLRS
jgi:hypothetical protein